MLTWIDLIQIGLASSVVAALVAWVKDLLSKNAEMRLDGKFAAIEIIARLDLYVIQSGRNIARYWENCGPLIPERDYQNWPECSYPSLDLDTSLLKKIKAEHASALAWMQTEKEFARDYVYSIWDDECDPSIASNAQADMVGYFGYEAYILSNKLRAKHKLPPFGTQWGTSEPVHLKAAWEDALTEKSNRLNLQAS